jgi:hypothetical protein
MFTLHAGEFLVGQYIEGNFKDKSVWMPTKDVGVDLLVTNAANTKTLSDLCTERPGESLRWRVDATLVG